MYATGTKKMLNMLILDILKKYSDENHRLTQQEIIRLLKSEYGMPGIDRRSVKNNVLSLKEMGYDIDMGNGYCLLGRLFDDAELRVLIDSILFSKYLTKEKSKQLIDKLCGLGNMYFEAKMNHIYSLQELQHTENSHVIYAVDTIIDAIAERKQISFVYNSYGMDFKLHPNRKERYVVNPYQMVVNNGRFYLMGNLEPYDNVSHYRIDKMTDVRLENAPAKPKNQVKEFQNGYSLPKHMSEHIYMFSGESVRVKLLVEDWMMNELIDWFGKEFAVCKSTVENKYEVRLKCNEEAMKHWALQYGKYVEVLEPQSLRNKVKETVEEMYHKYNS